MNKILILGVGNLLMRDEGFGIHAIKYLREHYIWPENTRLVDGGVMGLMLMQELMDCDLAIILDIALGECEPGAMYMGWAEDLGAALTMPYSMHHTDLKDGFISCDLAGHKPEAVLFCIQPLDFANVDINLSPLIAKKLPEFCGKVVAFLKDRNIPVRECDAE